MAEWYDSCLGTAYLAMATLVVFGCLWLPWAWWYDYKDGMSLRAKSRMGILGEGFCEDVDLKLFFVVVFVSSLMWGIIGGSLFGPDSWKDFLGGHDACQGYFFHVMLLYGFLWAEMGGLVGILACLVALLYVSVALVIEVTYFLWVGMTVSLQAIKKWTEKVLPRTWFLYFLTACIWGSFLVRRVVPAVFPLGFYNSVCLLGSDTICLTLTTGIVAAFVSAGWMGYKISPPALRSRFFLSPRPDAKLLDLTSKGVMNVWRGICPFLKIVRR